MQDTISNQQWTNSDNQHSIQDGVSNFHDVFQNDQPISSLEGLSCLMTSTTNVLQAQQTNFPNLDNQLSDIFPNDLIEQNSSKEKVPILSAPSSQFACNEFGCNKSYTTISGLNNHIKKY